MTELADLLWEKAEPVLFITREQFFEQWLDGWDIEGHHLDGELSWITCTKGPEFHFQSVGETKAMPLAMIRDFLRKIIAKHGFAMTRTPIENTRQQRFNRRFGFVECGRDAFDIHFRLDKI